MLKKTLAASLVLLLAALVSGFERAAEWVRYTNAEGRYSVLIPQQPSLKSQEATASTGEQFTQYMAQTSDADSYYMVSYFDYTTNMAFSLDKGRDGMVNAVNGTLLSEQSISLGGQPGRDLKVSATNQGIALVIRARMYNIGTRVYVLQHMFTKATDTATNAAKTTKFFDSFKLTPIK